MLLLGVFGAVDQRMRRKKPMQSARVFKVVTLMRLRVVVLFFCTECILESDVIDLTPG